MHVKHGTDNLFRKEDTDIQKEMSQIGHENRIVLEVTNEELYTKVQPKSEGSDKEENA